MMPAANTAQIDGFSRSTGSERVKPAECVAWQSGGFGTRRLQVRGSTGSRLGFAVDQRCRIAVAF